ncbi:hypothetical protein HYDPIDRAFT_118706 [Hydnomerulius pinastri MD-312]|uniref:DUF6533 domain-containing protein n=1 Tax=Hydnomerulius pinastri MD-312 TaxID=994086 RepID=A0A0C9VNQ7_9AGAM|nr:hypothetical protein HYDPIDRAFT_118706 [Hydnomerulius pinastri MD-312]
MDSTPVFIVTEGSPLAQIIKYCRVAPCAIWILDYLLTFDDELQSMRVKERWRSARILFLISRYMPVIGGGLSLYAATLPPMEEYKCFPLYGISGVNFLITILATEGLLFIRTWALWHDSRRMRTFITAVFSGLILFILLLLACAVASVGISNVPDLVVTDCLSLDVNPYDIIGIGGVAVFELVVCLLTAYRAIRLCKTSRTSKLLKSLCQGNLVYTITLLSMTTANIFVLLYVRIGGRSASLDQLQMVLHSVLASRILFNLRSIDRMEDSGMSLSVLRFASSPETKLDGEVSVLHDQATITPV